MAGGEVKLAARSLWKLFGPRAGEFLRAHPAPAADALAAAGLVAAVADVALTVRTGECFVIMGLSGSGKSTLVRCLARLVEPTAGEVLLDGRDLLRAAPGELIELRRHKLGMVFQHFALLPYLTVLGNVAFPLAVQGVARAVREARAMEMIRLVGLEGRERRYPRELSGGQQQRVGIARKTIVFITHDFDEAVRLADRIAIMRDGRIVQTGTPEELILRPADAYVAEFTKEAPRAKILTARAIMRPAQGTFEFAGELRPTACVAEFAAAVEGATRPFAVIEADRIVGLVDRGAVLRVLLGGEEPA
jgi:glycine betaine/proline transport system ATP-binding protein